jgi:hypothetical protein
MQVAGSRLRPVGRLLPVLQVEVLDARKGERCLAAKRLVRGCSECLLGGQIGSRRPGERLARILGVTGRAASRNLLSGGIVGIRLGECLEDGEAVGAPPESREIKDLNGRCSGGGRVFLAGYADEER